jgi:GT2 family glycosyltransferase
MLPMLGIVIVVYRDFEGTVAYVRDQLPRLTVPWKAVVVDLAATPATTGRLAAACGGMFVEGDAERGGAGATAGSLYVLCERENLGYARGNNRGTRFLLEKFPGMEWLLFSNSDVEIIGDDVAEKLIAVLKKHPDVACVGPRIVSPDGSEQLPFQEPLPVGAVIRHNLFSPFAKMDTAWEKRYKVAPGTRDGRCCAWVSGSFFMVRAADFIAAGMFDEATFLYFEEAILAARFETIGKRCYYEPAAVIRHLSGQTTARHLEVPALLTSELASSYHYYRLYRRIGFRQRLLFRCGSAVRLAWVRAAAVKNRWRQKRARAKNDGR